MYCLKVKGYQEEFGKIKERGKLCDLVRLGFLNLIMWVFLFFNI